MKKISILWVLCLLVCVLTGCAVSHAEMAKDGPSPTAAPPAVDLDLSRLSGTVVYSLVYNMTEEPEAYIGKVIKMSGFYDFFEDDISGVVYHACIIPDATACCAQGIEFIWSGEHQWPDDYPEAGTDIIVTGRLESYDEGEYRYLHLVDSEVLWEGETNP